MAQNFQANSSDNNYTSDFLEYKKRVELTEPIIINEDNRSPINSPITQEELRYAIDNSKNSSPGPDHISIIFLKHLPESGIEILLKIYNKIYTEKTFVNEWREATIIPILKPKCPKMEARSYRPISLTNTMCKVMEKIINKRLCHILEKERSITKYQSGFRKNRSTTDN